MDFGFTNDDAKFAAANAWREAAIADGWEATPCYSSEPLTAMCHLSRDGFKVRVASREKQGKWKYMADVCGWGPDGLSIRLPTVYSGFELIQQQLRHCNKCEADDVDTQQYSFAGRCCSNCIDQARKQHEYPGWNS